MKIHNVTDSIKVVEIEGQHIVTPFAVTVYGVDVSYHNTLSTATDAAKNYSRVLYIAASERA